MIDLRRALFCLLANGDPFFELISSITGDCGASGDGVGPNKNLVPVYRRRSYPHRRLGRAIACRRVVIGQVGT